MDLTPELGVDTDTMDPAVDTGRVGSDRGSLAVMVKSLGYWEHPVDPAMTTVIRSVVGCGGRVLHRGVGYCLSYRPA
jgi:hypothetical protein